MHLTLQLSPQLGTLRPAGIDEIGRGLQMLKPDEAPCWQSKKARKN